MSCFAQVWVITSSKNQWAWFRMSGKQLIAQDNINRIEWACPNYCCPNIMMIIQCKSDRYGRIEKRLVMKPQNRCVSDPP